MPTRYPQERDACHDSGSESAVRLGQQEYGRNRQPRKRIRYANNLLRKQVHPPKYHSRKEKYRKEVRRIEPGTQTMIVREAARKSVQQGNNGGPGEHQAKVLEYPLPMIQVAYKRRHQDPKIMGIRKKLFICPRPVSVYGWVMYDKRAPPSRMTEKSAIFRATGTPNTSRIPPFKRKGLAISKTISIGYKGMPKEEIEMKRTEAARCRLREKGKHHF